MVLVNAAGGEPLAVCLSSDGPLFHLLVLVLLRTYN